MALRMTTHRNVIAVHVSEKLSKEDYENLVPSVEKLIEAYGKVRILFDMCDFKGWELAALWEDIKFDWKHYNDVERIALVGEAEWQHKMAQFCSPFTTAEIKYFEHNQLQEAEEWLDVG